MNFDFLIVGGGTAGYVTALILKSAYPETSIGLIKSDKINYTFKLFHIIQT